VGVLRLPDGSSSVALRLKTSESRVLFVLATAARQERRPSASVTLFHYF